MEIYHCLNDIITTIEKESEVIGKAIFAYGSFAFIDFNKLKYTVTYKLKYPCYYKYS